MILLWSPYKAFESSFFKGEAFAIIVDTIASAVQRFNTEDKVLVFEMIIQKTNIGRAQHYGKNPLATKLRNLWNRQTLGIVCHTHRNVHLNKTQHSNNQYCSCTCQNIHIIYKKTE